MGAKPGLEAWLACRSRVCPGTGAGSARLQRGYKHAASIVGGSDKAGATRNGNPGDYPPLGDYAVIGDGRTAALVSRFGSVDWLCLPHFSGPAVFGAILDRRRGGTFVVRPDGIRTITRRYIGPTNVLATTFRAEQGAVRVTDLMPIAAEGLQPERELLRIVDGLEGEVDLRVSFAPRPDYARARVRLVRRSQDTYACTYGDELLALRTDLALEIDREGDDATGRIRVGAGERHYLSLGYTRGTVGVLAPLGQRADQRLAATLRWWEDWSGRCRYDGPYRDAVLRSLLTVKLMTYALSGALVAAPSASLPEVIGGSANWDYRFCWLRDAALALQTLMELGYSSEAEAFFRWLLHATRLTRPRLQVLYDVYGAADLPEIELAHLEGYAGSRPVRIGNAACRQRQLDVYGEVVTAAYAFIEGGGRIDRYEAGLLSGFGRTVCREWREPDQGIWESRGSARHHTQSKMMCWVALDRLLQLHADGRIDVPAEAFRKERATIHDAVETRGYNEELDSYVGVFDSRTLDASLLLMARYGYLDAAHPRMRATYRRLEQHLGRDALLFRFADADAVCAPAEGAFGLCGFWAVDYLARLGELQKAADRFERLLSFANDLGLYAEEIDPSSGQALGNFPQTYTHVGLIAAALSLGRPAARARIAA
jgi:GH15 family glucan-1,4-alpha-glucosidase